MLLLTCVVVVCKNCTSKMSGIKKLFGMITSKKNSEPKREPKKIVGATNYLFEREGTEVRPLPIFTSIIKVTSYDDATLLLTRDKQVFVIGKNGRSQLGLKQDIIETPTKLDLDRVIDVGTNEGKTLF